MSVHLRPDLIQRIYEDNTARGEREIESATSSMSVVGANLLTIANAMTVREAGPGKTPRQAPAPAKGDEVRKQRRAEAAEWAGTILDRRKKLEKFKAAVREIEAEMSADEERWLALYGDL